MEWKEIVLCRNYVCAMSGCLTLALVNCVRMTARKGREQYECSLQIVSLLGILWTLALVLNSPLMLAELRTFYQENQSEDKYEQVMRGELKHSHKITIQSLS